MRSALIELVSLGLALMVGCAISGAVAHAADGDVLWEDRIDGPAHLEEVPALNATVIHGDAVYVAGHATAAVGNVGRLVRAYELGTGRLLWEDRHDAADRRDLPTALAVEGNGVFTAGSTLDGNEFRGLVRAYDRRTGRVLWEDVSQPVGNTSAHITVKNGRVFVVGTVGVRVGFVLRSDTVVRAYDAQTGALLWQDVRGLPAFEEFPRAIATDGQRVFVVENSWHDTLGIGPSAIRAYDPRTGTLLWQDQLAAPVNGLSQVGVAGRRVFVAGGFYIPGVIDAAFLRAYHVASGETLWETLRSEPGEYWSGAATSMAARDGRVVIAGAVLMDVPGDVVWDLVVGAYDADGGALIWEDRVDVGTGDEALAVVASADRVFVTGWVGDQTGDAPGSDFFVRAYDAPSGRIRWSDRVDGGVNGGGLAIATRGDRVVAVGAVDSFLENGDTNRDFFIRAYDAR